MDTLKRANGNWVDREKEIASFTKYLKEGAHLYLTAPRRTGKTSLLYEVGRRIGDEVVYLVLDIEDCHAPEDVIVAISVKTRDHRPLWAVTKEVFKNTLSSLGERVDSISVDEVSVTLRAGLTSDWQPRGSRLIAELAKTDKPIVICLDELPVFVNRLMKGAELEINPTRLAQAEAWMFWLRAMNIAHRGKIRFVLCGSIGLEPVLRQGGLSGTITTFEPFPLDPWDAQTAQSCLWALSAGYNVSFMEGALERIVALLGCCIPHHVQLFFDLLYEDARRRDVVKCSTHDVDRVYKTRMISSSGHAELSQLEERLAKVLGRRKMPLALDLLTEAATQGLLTAETARILARDNEADLRTATATLREVLGILEHDGYLVKQDDGYIFLSLLLRDWWKARFEFGYTPASERGVQ